MKDETVGKIRSRIHSGNTWWSLNNLEVDRELQKLSAVYR